MFINTEKKPKLTKPVLIVVQQAVVEEKGESDGHEDCCQTVPRLSPANFFVKKRYFYSITRYAATGENDDASVICPSTTITPASKAESSTTFMRKRSSNDCASSRMRSLNTFPTAHDNCSLIRIFNKLYSNPVALSNLYKGKRKNKNAKKEKNKQIIMNHSSI